MSARILDGKALSQVMKQSLADEIASLKHSVHLSPRIVSIVVGHDPASLSYALSQQRAAESLGIEYALHQEPGDIPVSHLVTRIQEFNQREDIHGIILNKPLPVSMNFTDIADVIAKGKDIEGMRLCTPAAAMALLKSTGISLVGQEAVVLGRSEIVGRPMAMLLLDERCTVTVCHSATFQSGALEGHLKRADIVVAALGKPNFVQGEWLKEGAIVIDVGINRVGSLVTGDVDFASCQKRASYITPVPGGVGPVTSVILMENALKAFRNLVCQKS